MQCLEVSGVVRPIYGSLSVKRLKGINELYLTCNDVLFNTCDLWNLTYLTHLTHG